MANSATARRTIVDIYGEIGFYGATADEFVAALREVDADEIELHLSSPGGDVFEGLAIYQALLDHPAFIDVQIDSLAASIASVIAQAGDRITIAGNAQMMIHDAIGWCNGQAIDMRTTADLLDRASDNIAAVYAERSDRGTPKSWRKAMVADGLMGTWFGAQEAVDIGLADTISKAGKRGGNDPEAQWAGSLTARYLERMEARASILDRIEAARVTNAEGDDEDEDDEEQPERDHVTDCTQPADGCDCPVAAAEDDEDEDDGEEAFPENAAPAEDVEIDDDAIEAALAGSPLRGRAALLQAAAEVFEPDVELLEACLELAAKDAVRLDPEAISRGAAGTFRPKTDFLVHALEAGDTDAARADAARAAASFEPDGHRLAASLDDRPAFPRTGQTDHDPLTDLQRRTRSLLEAMQ
ncbi:MAG TPA: head maturation protease, ClpP-related [Iamia sp.]